MGGEAIDRMQGYMVPSVVTTESIQHSSGQEGFDQKNEGQGFLLAFGMPLSFQSPKVLLYSKK